MAPVVMALTLMGGRAEAQGVPVEAQCLCDVAGQSAGVYLGRVRGGRQVGVEEVLLPAAAGRDPQEFVVLNLDEAPGTRVIASSDAWLVVEPGDRVRCPGAECGSAWTIPLPSARTLVSSSSPAACRAALQPEMLSGETPECSAGGGGGCRTASQDGTPASLVMGMALVALLGRRRAGHAAFAGRSAA
jgi:uncharacterized protein (TIGR03382 family)